MVPTKVLTSLSSLGVTCMELKERQGTSLVPLHSGELLDLMRSIPLSSKNGSPIKYIKNGLCDINRIFEKGLRINSRKDGERFTKDAFSTLTKISWKARLLHPLEQMVCLGVFG